MRCAEVFVARRAKLKGASALFLSVLIAAPAGRSQTSAGTAPSPPVGADSTAGPKQTLDAVVAEARTAADRLAADLPNLTVSQVTTRYVSKGMPAHWTKVDVVSAEVVSVDGKEDYRNIRLNGKPIRASVWKTGSWSSGEFVSMLKTLLSPRTAAEFTPTGEAQITGRPAYLYHFNVRQPNSSWGISAPGGRYETPAYTGAVWIDKESHRVLRIEQRTGPMSDSFPVKEAEFKLDYGFVRVEGNTYLLPVHGGALACERPTGHCTLNETEFRDYRKFTAGPVAASGP
ncbi:MAG: hypothetical protein ACLQGV_16750 [Bryobacteraceae bacterium]